MAASFCEGDGSWEEITSSSSSLLTGSIVASRCQAETRRRVVMRRVGDVGHRTKASVRHFPVPPGSTRDHTDRAPEQEGHRRALLLLPGAARTLFLDWLKTSHEPLGDLVGRLLGDGWLHLRRRGIPRTLDRSPRRGHGEDRRPTRTARRRSRCPYAGCARGAPRKSSHQISSLHHLKRHRRFTFPVVGIGLGYRSPR